MAITAEAIFKYEGDTIPYIPSGAAVAAGQVVVVGDIVAVAKQDIADGVEGALYVEGVFECAKTAGVGEAIAVGVKVYWDDSANVVTTTAGALKVMGVTTIAAADAATVTRVKLTPNG